MATLHRPVDDSDVGLAQEVKDKTTNISVSYGEAWPLRAIVQVIPIAGGALDALFSGIGANYEHQRITEFLRLLDERLQNVEGRTRLDDVTPSEPLYDYIVQVLDAVRRSRSYMKRERLANMTARQIVHSKPWNEAEAAAKALDSLSELEMEIVLKARSVVTRRARGVCYPWFSIEATGWAKQNGDAAFALTEAFPNVPSAALHAVCSQLIAKGFVHDHGIGRLDVGALELLALTEFADWFVDWMERPTGTVETKLLVQ